MQEWIIANSAWFTPIAGLAGSLIGFVFLAIVMSIGFGRLYSLQREQLELIGRNEKTLKKREKTVIASALAGELTENRIKCQSFIMIYNELLRSLRDSGQPAQYEEVGDSIHQRPPLSRMVFDANVDKISIFGSKIAGELAGVYAAVRQDPEYYNLEKGMPRTTAIRMVEMVLSDAQKTMEPMDSIISALNIIIRDSGQD